MLLVVGLGLLMPAGALANDRPAGPGAPTSSEIRVVASIGKAPRILREDKIAVPARTAWLGDAGDNHLFIGDSDIWNSEQKSIFHKKNAAIDAFPDPTGRLLGAQIREIYDGAKEGYRTGSYLVYDRNGHVVHRILDVDGRLIFTPAPDGSFVIARHGALIPPSPPVRFVRQSRMPAPGWSAEDRCLGVAIAPNSNWMALTAGDESPARIILYSRDFKKISALPAASTVRFCSDSKCVMTYEGEILRLYDNKGALISQFSLPGMLTETLEFLPNGDGVAVVLAGTELKRFDRKSGNSVWNAKLSDRVLGKHSDDTAVQIIGMQVASLGKTIALVARAKKSIERELSGWGKVTDVLPTRDSIVLFDERGNHLNTLTLPGTPHLTSRPAFQLSRDGKKITIRLPTGIVTYELGG